MTKPTERETPGDAERVDVTLGARPSVDPGAVLGYRYGPDAGPTVVGDDARIRSGTILYGDVRVGDDFATGHGALVREGTTAGDEVLVGTDAVVDGATTLGSRVSLQTRVYVPRETTVGDQVFLGPGATLTNDRYPVRTDADLAGPTVEDHVSVGANATVLPGVTLGEGSFVAAGAVVDEDVPPRTLAVGVPAEHRPLPADLQGVNDLG